jgi:hypothetical protein
VIWAIVGRDHACVPSRPLQSKKLLDADVLGEFEQGIEMLVLAQRLAIDFNFER